MAVVKRRHLTEELAADKARFVAFMVATLCERLEKGGLVYHGRTGHVVLPGLANVFRIRAITDQEDRIARAMARLGVPRDKARQYIEDVDEDRYRWVRALYGLDWNDPSQYDTVVNLTHMSVDNAAAALVTMAQLPEFQSTPASRRLLADLWLAAKCRLAIGRDPKTRRVDVTVRAERGQVAVTYLPRDRQAAALLPPIIEQVDGVTDVRCTMATTSILWVQERFDPEGASLSQVLDVAERWGAAVELARLVPGADAEQPEREPEDVGDEAAAPAPVSAPAVGGIIDDTDEEDEEPGDDGGLEEMVDRLVQAGRAGGAWQVTGDPQSLVSRLDVPSPYSLVVVENLYLGKGEAVRKRMVRELTAYLSEHLRVPVIGPDELKTQLLFGPRQWVRLLVALAITVAVVFAVFTYQEPLLTWLTREGTTNRILAVTAIALFVPMFAYVYGTFTQYLLRLFKFE
jgi:cytidylate kinase